MTVNVAFTFTALLAFVVLLALGRQPSVASLTAFFNALNTRGGNIAMLSIMVVFFVTTAMRYTYYLVGLEVSGKLTKESALAMNGFTFITGSVVGLAIGAWLKALSPQDIATAPSDGSTTTQSTTVVSSTPMVTPVVTVTPPAVSPQQDGWK